MPASLTEWQNPPSVMWDTVVPSHHIKTFESIGTGRYPHSLPISCRETFRLHLEHAQAAFVSFEVLVAQVLKIVG